MAFLVRCEACDIAEPSCRRGRTESFGHGLVENHTRRVALDLLPLPDKMQLIALHLRNGALVNGVKCDRHIEDC